MNFPNTSLLTSSLHQFSVKASPNIIFANISVSSNFDKRSSSSLILLDLDVINSLIFEFFRYLNEIKSEPLSERHGWFIVLAGVKQTILNHFVELTKLFSILGLCFFVELGVLLELLMVIVIASEVDTGLSEQIVLFRVLKGYISHQIILKEVMSVFDIFLLLISL